MLVRIRVLVCAALLVACSGPTTEPAGSPVDTAVETASNQPASSPPAESDDPLLVRELVDVRTGAAFTLAELAADGPVIVQTMAIWCSTCRAQMHEVTAAHGLADFHSVSIDVEPTEIAGDLAAYADQQGFDWRFALADAELANLLRDRFGTAVLNPPGTPKILIRRDGSVELLPIGDQLSAQELAELVGG